MTQITTNTNIWILAGKGGIIGAAINSIIFLIAGNIQVPNPNTNTLESLPIFAVIAASLIPAFIGAGILLGFQKFVANGTQVFLIIGAILGLLSNIPMLTMPITTETKIALFLMHIVAATSILISLSRAKKA
jgi:hypothetical protein